MSKSIKTVSRFFGKWDFQDYQENKGSKNETVKSALGYVGKAITNKDKESWWKLMFIYLFLYGVALPIILVVMMTIKYKLKKFEHDSPEYFL